MGAVLATGRGSPPSTTTSPASTRGLRSDVCDLGSVRLLEVRRDDANRQPGTEPLELRAVGLVDTAAMTGVDRRMRGFDSLMPLTRRHGTKCTSTGGWPTCLMVAGRWLGASR